MIEYLEWDSSFFGYKVGRVTIDGAEKTNIDNIVRSAKNDNYRLLYFFAKVFVEITHQDLIKNGAALVDTKLTYLKEIGQEIAAIDENIFSWLNRPISPKLYSIALQSGIYSRFYIDKNFKNNEYKELYCKWLENSVKGEIAREVFLFKDNDNELGVLTLGVKNNRADIGLIAVDENARGRSIGKKLVEAATKTAADRQFKELQVITQAENKNACFFYEHLGFNLISKEYIYHLWI